MHLQLLEEVETVAAGKPTLICLPMPRLKRDAVAENIALEAKIQRSWREGLFSLRRSEGCLGVILPSCTRMFQA